MDYIVACVIVVGIVVAAVVPWRRVSMTKDFDTTNHPSACIDCNRGSCHGCALEGLNKTEADAVATQLTQQAIADNTIAYGRRFQKEV